jgi:hypothetical protein
VGALGGIAQATAGCVRHPVGGGSQYAPSSKPPLGRAQDVNDFDTIHNGAPSRIRTEPNQCASRAAVTNGDGKGNLRGTEAARVAEPPVGRRTPATAAKRMPRAEQSCPGILLGAGRTATDNRSNLRDLTRLC